jgi:hypothetical protein
MAHMQSWNSGYSDSRVRSGGQLHLHCATCTLEDSYLHRHCGDCNPMCALLQGRDDIGSVHVGLSPNHSALPEALANIGGLQWNISGRSADCSHMAEEVNLVWDNASTIPPGDHLALAIRPRDLFPAMREDGGPSRSSIPDIRNRLRLSPETTLWLAPGAHDNVIEWMYTHPDYVLDTLRANQFEVLVPSDFSVAGEQCPVNWRISGKRALMMHAELSRICRSTAVTISIPNSFFAREWALWFREYPSANCACINAQLWGSQRTFETMFAQVELFRDLVGRDLHYIIAGPTADHKIAKVRDALPSCTIVSSLYYNRWKRNRAGRN